MSKASFDIDIIGYDCGWGCRDWGCEDGPEAVEKDLILATLQKQGHRPNWTGTIGAKALGRHDQVTVKDHTLPFVLKSLQKLYDRVYATVKDGRLPLVIGGDHSSGIATWSAIAAARGLAGKMGLVWIDAHLDSHTYETSFQGKYGGWWHGQPVAALLGHGLAEFTEMGGKTAKISPEHLFFIGAHSFEPLEKELLDQKKVHIFMQETVAKTGFEAIFKKMRSQFAAQTQGFGVSIDLDVFRPEDAPGVGAPEETGLAAAAVLPGLRHAAHQPGFLGIEIVEYNPGRDIDRKTSRLVTQIIAEVFQSDG